MCGRVVSARPLDVLAAELGVDEVVASELPPRWNVAPGTDLYAVASTSSGRRLGALRWGLVPSWAGTPTAGPRPINARAETIMAKRHFAECLARRRCLVPVDGWYEWETLPGGVKRPHFLSRPDGRVLALAGLWDRWRRVDPPLVTCAIVTTAANDDVRGVHSRMPVMVEEGDWDRWLGGGDPLALLRPAPPGLVAARPVTPLVNSTANDGPDLLSA